MTHLIQIHTHTKLLDIFIFLRVSVEGPTDSSNSRNSWPHALLYPSYSNHLSQGFLILQNSKRQELWGRKERVLKAQWGWREDQIQRMLNLIISFTTKNLHWLSLHRQGQINPVQPTATPCPRQKKKCIPVSWPPYHHTSVILCFKHCFDSSVPLHLLLILP